MPGTISGTVKLSGKLPREGISPEPPRDPKGRPIDFSKAKRFILGEDGTLANVYVAVKSGLGDRKFETPREPVIVNLTGFLYLPRVLGVMTDQPMIFRNGDDVLHDVHANPNYGVPFNYGLVSKDKQFTTQFSKAEIGIQVRCDVHPWMHAWIHVSEHPHFAVTETDGKYSLTGLPPGEYEILAWHEGFQKAPLVSNVKVEPGATSTLNFTFELPRK